MSKVRARQKFGDWLVLDSTRVKDAKYQIRILCMDEIANEISYVRLDYLLTGSSTKHISRRNENGGGHSTRFKDFELPKHVYAYNSARSIKKFRVAVKGKVKGQKTLGYFYSVEDAEVFIEENQDLFKRDL